MKLIELNYLIYARKGWPTIGGKMHFQYPNGKPDQQNPDKDFVFDNLIIGDEVTKFCSPSQIFVLPSETEVTIEKDFGHTNFTFMHEGREAYFELSQSNLTWD